MDQPILNKIIHITAKEEGKTRNGLNTQIRLTDHDNVKFAFFKKKQAGTAQEANTAVFEQFKNMGLDEGSTVRIGYVVEEYTDTKGFTRSTNKIINFSETTEKPSPSPAATNTSPQSSSPLARQVLDVSIVRQVAFKGAIELARDGIVVIDQIGKYTDDFERLLRRPALMNPIDSHSAPEALPVIQQNPNYQEESEDLAKDIPF